MSNCLIINDRIKELYNSINDNNESIDSIKNLIALWQKKNKKGIEEYPTKDELSKFIIKVREGTPLIEDRKDQVNKVYTEFDPITRRDRVTLISRFFSNEVDSLMESTRNDLSNRISNTDSIEERAELIDNLENLSRLYIINSYTPNTIFNRVLDVFKDYVNTPIEEIKKQEIEKIINNDNNQVQQGVITEDQKFSIKEIEESTNGYVPYKIAEYKKVIDNFTSLVEESSRILVESEGIRIEIDSLSSIEMDSMSENEEIGEIDKEITPKDNWMVSFREVSSYDSLSKDVRKALNNIPKLDYNGNYEEDDLGNLRYLDPTYTHAALIDGLRNMLNANDLIPSLTAMTKTKPWVSQIIEVLSNDDNLFSQFYQNFSKDTVNYWIQIKTTLPNGNTKIETKNLTKPEGVYYLLDNWRDNYESGSLLDEDSVYNKNGSLNISNAEKGLGWLQALNNKFSSADTIEGLKLLDEDRIFKTIQKLLNMIGIDSDPIILKNALTDIKSSENIIYPDPIKLLIPQLNVIYNGVVKQSEDKRIDLINTFSGAYNRIAQMLSDVTDNAIENSIRENGKSYFSFVNSNYLGRLFKQLKNVNKDINRFNEFIKEEYKQYDWFYKNNEWKNDWLKQIESSERIREGLSHKVLLHSDKIKYEDWDSLDMTLVMLNEYWSDPNSDWAWYHVPILSDNPSAEFIRFKKDISGSVIDTVNGGYRSYQDILLDKFTDLVEQEQNRIILVKKRHEESLKGNSNISKINNYDINGNKLGGAEFKFLPELNNIKNENGVAFIDILSSETDGSKLKEYIRSTISKVLNNRFEEAYEKWRDVGLFEELPNGRYKHINFNSQTQQIQKITSALLSAESLIGKINSVKIVTDYNNGSLSDDQLLDLIQEVKDTINEDVDNGKISSGDAYTILNKLTLKNPAKDALREYFWNSAFATSQIIQLTTTDLAFYSSIEDFQKRYKQVHSSTLRLNTLAKYKDQLIGRDWEKTIYLKDDIIQSAGIKDIEEALEAKVKKSELSNIDKDYILTQYGKLLDKNSKGINVADAQAYRSLSSYKAILGMSGQWTDEMEIAFNNFQNNTWDIKDFNIIWQTKKPFVYTQVNNISGIANTSGIKTPVQHKNSEFLLLAMYNFMGPLGNSEKLKAINTFMEENNIDVVQFESTTKVGKQGVININNAKTFNETISLLNKAIKIDGIENPNVVHKISYADYGIQVETPEHSIDAFQLIGSQIRKLIMADISNDPNLRIDLNGKKLTKQEWINLYNEINTENILQSFLGVNEIFKDPKEVEKVLLEEIKGNKRYGNEMIKACTLDNNGNFNIPLFDPIQSQLVQTLLNSVIKNRITKQKIRGGALIQVSNYGLTDKLNIVYEGIEDDKRIKHIECFMPAYSRKFYEPLMKEDGTLDISKLPTKLRRAIGYRVPTEGKNSMVPLFIKGFLPQQNGSAIMLPADITTMAGSDFDVDKLFIMLPEFSIEEYSYQNAREDFNTEQRILGNLSSLFKEGNIIEDIANAPLEFKEWFNQNKSKYKLEKANIKWVKYNTEKSAKENNLKARNNMLIDLMWGVLTNSDSIVKILSPNNFDYQKKAARIMDILDLGLSYKYNQLVSLSIPQLEDILDEFKTKLHPLSPITQVQLHQQNMTGSKLIGIYANHNANHALAQFTKMVLSKYGKFTLNSKSLTTLNSIMNPAKELISRNTSGFLSASVDNAKDPILASLNQNTFTANTTMLLSRLGYNPIEIGLLMTQPIVKEITKVYLRESRNGGNKTAIIKRIINEYKSKAGITNEVSYDTYKDNQFTNEDLANSIYTSKHLDNNNTTRYYNDQVAVGTLFERVMKTSDVLSMIVQATRSDTQGGAAGPTIADTVIKLQKVDTLIDRVYKNQYFPISNADIINQGIEFKSEDNLRKELLESQLPFLQSFYSLGLYQSNTLFEKYFPHFTTPFKDVIDSLTRISKSNKLDKKTLNSIYDELLMYIMTKTQFFGNEGNSSSFTKRKDFIYSFPEYFSKIYKENDDIASLEFIKRLTIAKPAKNNPVASVVFKNVGRLNSTLKDRYMADWESLLYMDNPRAQELALNLFRYSFYRNGFVFGPNSFIHLAPISIRKAIPEYVSSLQELLSTTDDYNDFVEQYIYNHIDNRKLVPNIEDPNISIEDNDGKVVNDLILNKNITSILKEDSVLDGEVFSFISIRDRNNKPIYYRLINTNTDSITYTRIYPLGIKNNTLEYEYGKSAIEIDSIFSDVEVVEEEVTVEEDDIDVPKEKSIDTEIKKDTSINLDNMSTNTEFTDANNEYLCGR